MRDQTTLIHDILEELRPGLPADFQFSVVQDPWEDITMTEFQSHGQTAGSWVKTDAQPHAVAEKVLHDLHGFLTNPDLFDVLPLDPRTTWRANDLLALALHPQQLQHT